jgi:hypothetical protein
MNSLNGGPPVAAIIIGILVIIGVIVGVVMTTRPVGFTSPPSPAASNRRDVAVKAVAMAQKNAGKPVQIMKSPSPYSGGKIAEVKVAQDGKMVKPGVLTNVTVPKLANAPVKQKVISRQVQPAPPREGNLVCPPGQYLSQYYCYRQTSGSGPQYMGMAEREMICSVPNFTTLVNGRCYGGCPDGYAVNPNDTKSCLLNGEKP